jgi:hypothetical protein
MSDNSLRAIIFLPLVNYGMDILFDNSDHDFIDDIEFSAAFVKVRNDLKAQYKWKFGPLDPLTSDGLTSQPLNSAIGNDISFSVASLIGMRFQTTDSDNSGEHFWHSRRSLNLSNSDIDTGIKGVVAEGFELLKYPENDRADDSFVETYILAVHLSASDTAENRQTIHSLSKLSENPIKIFLNKFFRTPFNSTMDTLLESSTLPNKYDILKSENNPIDFTWNFHPLVSSSLIAYYFSGLSNSIDFKHSNLELCYEMNTSVVAQAKTKLVLIGTLITFQKLRVQSLRQNWPSLESLDMADVIKLRSRLNNLRRTWIWNRISLDNQVQDPFDAWHLELRISEDVKDLERDLREYWEIHHALSAEHHRKELVNFSRSIKYLFILAVIPAWLAVLIIAFPSWIASTFSLISIAFILAFPRKIENLLKKLEEKF